MSIVKISTGIMLLVALAAMTGCSTTRQARSTSTSGFLGNYTGMVPGGEGEALLLYINPRVRIANYDSIMLDPIRIYAAEDSAFGGASSEELRSILNYMDAAVREQLAKDYTLVKKPGPNTMRLRIALTEAEGSKRVLDTMSNIMPPAIAISALKTAITGKATGVGSARVEVEMLDSKSNLRLFAAVDERVGGKTFEGKFDKWDDVKQAIDYWATKLQERLAQERAKR